MLPNDIMNIVYDFLMPYPKSLLIDIKKFGHYFNHMLGIYGIKYFDERNVYTEYFDTMKKDKRGEIMYHKFRFDNMSDWVIYHILFEKYYWINNKNSTNPNNKKTFYHIKMTRGDFKDKKITWSCRPFPCTLSRVNEINWSEYMIAEPRSHKIIMLKQKLCKKIKMINIS